MQQTSHIARLRQLAADIAAATDEANADLQPLHGQESTEECAALILDSWIVAILNAILAAAGDDWFTPGLIVGYVERNAQTQDQRTGDALALLPWVVGDADNAITDNAITETLKEQHS